MSPAPPVRSEAKSEARNEAESELEGELEPEAHLSPYRIADDAHLREERAADEAIIAAVDEARELRLRGARWGVGSPLWRRAWPSLGLLALVALVVATGVWLGPFALGALLCGGLVVALFATIFVLSGRIPPKGGGGSSSPPRFFGGP